MRLVSCVIFGRPPVDRGPRTPTLDGRSAVEAVRILSPAIGSAGSVGSRTYADVIGFGLPESHTDAQLETRCFIGTE